MAAHCRQPQWPVLTNTPAVQHADIAPPQSATLNVCSCSKFHMLLSLQSDDDKQLSFMSRMYT